jgi:hypothetical protein
MEIFFTHFSFAVRLCSVIDPSSASQHHDWVFLLLLETRLKLRTQILYNGLPIFYYIYTHH